MENKRLKKENDEHNAISSSVTSERPRNCLFKIESLSLLQQALTKAKPDKCDSSQFEAGGYKWKLSLYPNGDKKRGGDGYISLYLALADPKSLPQGDEVHVFFKFFVYDDIRDTYLVLQDGKDRRFRATKIEFGFPKLLPLETFNDPCRGYLVDDCCMFGAELFFHKNETRVGSTLSIKNNLGPNETSFTWKIDKFSTLPEVHKSQVFTIGGTNCGKTGRGWGFNDLIKLSDLKNESRGFIVKDTVVLQVTIMSIFVYNTLP